MPYYDVIIQDNKLKMTVQYWEAKMKNVLSLYVSLIILDVKRFFVLIWHVVLDQSI